MGKKRRRNLGIILGISFCVLFLSFGRPAYSEEQKPVHLSLATFKSGSGWYIMGQTMADIMQKALPKGSTVDVLPYSGGVGNPLLLHQGKADLAMGFGVETGLAIKGESPYKESMKELRLLAAGFDTYWYAFAVREATGITSFKEIKEKHYPLRLVILPKGSSGEWDTIKIFKAYGMDLYADLKAWGGKVTNTSFPTAVEMMKDGLADAFGQLCTPGHPSWTQLATMAKIRFLPIDKEVRDQLIKEYGFRRGVIPAGTFNGVTKDVPVLGFATNLITTDKLPEEVAYKITKAICEHKQDLVAAYKAAKVFDPKTAWEEADIPLDPGAARYYKEAGYMH
jgi:TRAP transporter TAXI family solute receptor